MAREFTDQDERFIRRCIELSRQSLEAGDAPFGSLIVREGKIVVEARNDSNSKITDHAEIVALNMANERLAPRPSPTALFTRAESRAPCAPS